MLWKMVTTSIWSGVESILSYVDEKYCKLKFSDLAPRSLPRHYTIDNSWRRRQQQGSFSFAHACAFVLLGLFHKNLWNKWKNHFDEMKGDVGMSNREKEERKLEEPTLKQGETHNPISTSLFFQDCTTLFLYLLNKIIQNRLSVYNLKQKFSKQKCRDGVMNFSLFLV